MKTSLSLLTFIFISIAANAQVDLNNGLMLYLPFNGNTLDASGNNNHATNFGTTFDVDQWGNANSACYFDGSSNYLQIPNSATLQMDTAMTLCARVNVKGFYNGNCHGNLILQKGGPAATTGEYALLFSPNNDAIGCSAQDTAHQFLYGNVMGYYGGFSVIDSGSYYLQENQWYCMVLKYDGSTVKTYVNGIMRYQFPFNTPIGTNTADLFLGKLDAVTAPYWFHGAMDEIRIYNRALNTEEVDSVCSIYTIPESVKDIQPEEALTLVPNPATNSIMLTLANDQMGGILTIIDMAGNTVNTIPALNKNTISIENLSSGIYRVSYQKNGIIMKGRFNKQ